MPEFDYEEFDRRQAEWEAQNRDMDEDEDRGDNMDADNAPKFEAKAEPEDLSGSEDLPESKPKDEDDIDDDWK